MKSIEDHMRAEKKERSPCRLTIRLDRNGQFVACLSFAPGMETARADGATIADAIERLENALSELNVRRCKFVLLDRFAPVNTPHTFPPRTGIAREPQPFHELVCQIDKPCNLLIRTIQRIFQIAHACILRVFGCGIFGAVGLTVRK